LTLIVAEGKVYLGDEDGDFVILAAAKEKRILSETNFGAPIYSTPVAANGALYIKSATHLFVVRDLGVSAGELDNRSGLR
jgi:outer membrane protein assembly factor BamB